MKAVIRNTSNKSPRNTCTRTTAVKNTPSRNTSKTNPRSKSKKSVGSSPSFLFLCVGDYIEDLKEQGIDHLPVIRSLENILIDRVIGPDGNYLPPRESSYPQRAPICEPEPLSCQKGRLFEKRLVAGVAELKAEGIDPSLLFNKLALKLVGAPVDEDDGPVF